MALKVETCTVVTAELQLPLPLLQMCLTASTSAVNVRQTYRLNEHYSYKIVVIVLYSAPCCCLQRHDWQINTTYSV